MRPVRARAVGVSLGANVVLFVVSLLLLATGDPGPGVAGVFLWLAGLGFVVVNVVVVVALGRQRVGRCMEAALGLLAVASVLSWWLVTMIPKD